MKRFLSILAFLMAIVLLLPACKDSNLPEESTPDVTTPQATTPEEALDFQQGLRKILGQGVHAGGIACRQDQTFHKANPFHPLFTKSGPLLFCKKVGKKLL